MRHVGKDSGISFILVLRCLPDSRRCALMGASLASFWFAYLTEHVAGGTAPLGLPQILQTT